MPFDCLSPLRNTSLTDCVRDLGIIPIDPATLEMHKREQLRAHPPNFAFRHAALLSNQIGIPLLAGTGSSVGCFMFPGRELSVIAVALIAVIVLALVLPRFVLRGLHPEWIEEQPSELPPEVPAAVAAIANEIREVYPGCKLVLGTLIQVETKVVLDPYLALEANGKRVIIGIWEDDQVLHLAERRHAA